MILRRCGWTATLLSVPPRFRMRVFGMYVSAGGSRRRPGVTRSWSLGRRGRIYFKVSIYVSLKLRPPVDGERGDTITLAVSSDTVIQTTARSWYSTRVSASQRGQRETYRCGDRSDTEDTVSPFSNIQSVSAFQCRRVRSTRSPLNVSRALLSVFCPMRMVVTDLRSTRSM